ncbi:transporter substrate-binding domain-containing protein [Desulfoluna spongiiphila]|uniref:histidine kinase n=1 Tax=Desulfoluna spongiiphila TaxID=419481 RepID=A0A1G5IZG6_9BACT|nr:transporter substrate-binding domain-containing protein [Desulfoluna spongiiphila]SCY81505.1 polar amino acid transport system substrate-binding protein [Desulfoluna spongiiphila]
MARRGLFLILCLALLAAGTTALAAPPKRIVFGGDAQYPPYEFLDKNGDPTGFTVELTRALAEVMGMEIEIRLGPWEEIMEAFKKGEVDVMQGISYSKERAGRYEFSQAYTLIHHSIFTREETIGVSSLSHLAGKKVLVQHDGIMHETLRQSDLRVTPVPVPYQTDALRMVASGTYDHAIVANLPGLYYIREHKLTNIRKRGNPVAVQLYCYATVKDNTELMSQISEGLAILKKTGRLRGIHNRWLGVLSPGIPTRKLIIAASLLFTFMALVVVGNVLWSRTLKREVALRTRQLETRQKQLLQADKMASLGFLVSGIAHELNNPNGLLLLNIPLLVAAFKEMHPVLEKHYRDHGDFKVAGLPYSRMRDEIPLILDETNDAARHIKTIVEDLRDFSRQSDDEKEETDINAIAVNALRLVRPAVEKATRHLGVELREGIPPILANPQRIEQVVVNLLLNACQALDNPESAIRLQTATDARQGIVTLSVTDQGTGIDPEHLDHLTDPFFTTKRSAGGTGLGLSVSAGIVRNHQGKLTFESKPGQGTTATLQLPVLTKE